MAAREDVSFESGGERCAAWLYRPEGEGPHPCVVLAHGFGGTREGRLGAFAERFRDAGMAALVFDYRHFGDSGGEPRQLVSIRRQLDDWRSAVEFARSLDGIDPDRVALWGTSYSGGHVIRLAAEDDRIAAAVSQAPHTDGIATLAAAGLWDMTRMTIAGTLDLIAEAVGDEPHRIPIVAQPGDGAAMNQPGSKDGYLSLFDTPADFDNRVCARALLVVGINSPGSFAPKVNCPLLVAVVGGDLVTPPKPARKVAEQAPRGELIEYGEEWGHFDIYTGELFERAVADQTAFLTRALRPAVPAAA